MQAPREAKGQAGGMQPRANQRMPWRGCGASLRKKEVAQQADLDTELQAIIKPRVSCVLSIRLLQSRKGN